MICNVKRVHGDSRVSDDYEAIQREWDELVQTAYRDSLVVEGVAEAEDEDFVRRRWQESFVARLREFVADHGDGSTGAVSLQKSLDESEPRMKRDKVSYLVWLGPVAREWLRRNAAAVKTFFAGRYENQVQGL